MSSVAPTGRKHRAAAALCRLVRSGCANIPAYRLNEVDIAFAAALMAAFAMFALQAPSWLAFDTQRAEGNVGTISGLERVPGDPHRRERRDPGCPESFRPVFNHGFRQLQRGKALAAMVFFDDGSLVALDGPGDVASKTIHCAAWLHKVHRNGNVTYHHQM